MRNIGADLEHFPNEVFKLVAFTDSFLTFQVYLFLPLADADASA